MTKGPGAEDDPAEPDDALAVVDECEEEPDRKVRRVDGDELGQDCNIERTDLGVEEIPGLPTWRESRFGVLAACLSWLARGHQ